MAPVRGIVVFILIQSLVQQKRLLDPIDPESNRNCLIKMVFLWEPCPTVYGKVLLDSRRCEVFGKV